MTQPRNFTVSAGSLGAEGCWIGRAPDCAVPLDDPDRFVSLRHARLDFANGSFWLTDHSTNGTFVNGGTRLAKGERHRLAPGDTLRIGLFDISVLAGGSEAALAGLASPLDIASTTAPIVARDPLTEFASTTATPAQSVETPKQAGQTPDPFDALLAEFGQGSGAAPLPRFASDVPADPAPASAASGSLTPVPQPEPPRATSPAPPPDMLSAIATEVADLSPALRQQSPPPEAEARPAPQPMDTATAALAAFWCGLGIIPRALRPDDLVDVMAELGVAFREAADGLAAMSRTLGRNGADKANPFASGHAGLRRHLDGREGNTTRLDDAVREIFARAAEREAARQEATQAGVRKMAETLSATAIERRLGGAVHARRPKTRRAELWRMFHLMQEDLIQLAELRFRKEVEERMRGPRPPSRESDGFGL